MTLSAALLRDYATAVFRGAGLEPEDATDVAEHLVEANLLGMDSHGIIRVTEYLQCIDDKHVVANRRAKVIKDGGAFVLVDGQFGFGQTIGKQAVALGIERARRHGIALVGLRNSGHLGRIGAWPQMAAEAGIVSLHFVNSSGEGILVAPFGGKERRLSANPIAAGAPGADGKPIVFDVSTSAVAEGKVRVAKNKGEMLPEGVALDHEGRPIRDPNDFYGPPMGALLPFGGHKGSGLSFFAEIFAGSLTGGYSSHPRNPTADRFVNNMLSFYIDPAGLGLAEFFKEDVARLTEWIRSTPPAKPGDKVRAPGDVELATRAEREAKGIPLDKTTVAQLVTAGRRTGVSEAILARLQA
jgi:hydroxycarboxylate dehydrogenase B